MKTFKEYENIDKKCEEVIFEHELEGIQEAEYQGKKVKLNDPIRGGSKKFYVYVKDGDKVKKVSFEVMKDEILSGASLNRFVTHDDLAEQAHFLCSPLGKNISGQAVSVCGNIEKAG